jgi:hypothetical protein
VKVRYSHNNSGGGDWLTSQDWLALEDNGWTVDWVDNGWRDEPWAYHASIESPSLDIAVATWEHITGERAADKGCACCGVPHSFTADDNGKYVWWDGHDEYDDDDG